MAKAEPERCGAPTTSGRPCKFAPAEKCPHHPGPSPSGRPSLYTEELDEEICERLADGESLRAICRDDDMPNRRTVLRWLQDREDFRLRYEHARAMQAEGFGEEIVALSDELPDYASHEQISRQKLRIDSRKWVAARILPQKYGRTEKHEHSGPKGEPLNPTVVILPPKGEA